MERVAFFRRGYLIYRKAMRGASEKGQTPDMSRIDIVSKNTLANYYNNFRNNNKNEAPCRKLQQNQPN